MPNRTVFFISDGTGITAETFGNSILAQFALKPRHVRRPFIDSLDKADQVIAEINSLVDAEGQRPIIFITLVNDEVRHRVRERSRGLVLDMFNTFVAPLEEELGIKSNHRVGRFSDVAKSQEYHDRIEAINFSLAHDDGQSARNLEAADVILVGVSRSGKTPTSLYLAMQHGIKAANYPLIPEDFERGHLPRQPLRRPAQLPLRDRRGREDDEARGHLVAVLDAQVHRGDRHDDPARHPPRPPDLLSHPPPQRLVEAHRGRGGHVQRLFPTGLRNADGRRTGRHERRSDALSFVAEHPGGRRR
jgi:regulator of PEP synthase PpsR (kinase-PPPase family)